MRFRAARRLGWRIARTGDIVLAVNGQKVSSPAEVVALARTLPTGSDVAFELSRGGAPLTLRGKVQPKPFEQSREQ